MLTFLATLCAGLFAGAASYVTLVEHWARLEAGPDVALAQFRPGFPRARAMQSVLALGGGACALLATLFGHGSVWLLVSALLFGVVAFTVVRITPVYSALLDTSLTPTSPQAPELLARWGQLHRLRTVAGLLAFLLAVAGR